MELRSIVKPVVFAAGCIALATTTGADARGYVSVVVNPFAIIAPPPPPVVYEPAPYYPDPYYAPPVVYVGGGNWGGDRRGNYRGGHGGGDHGDHGGHR
jgi:hypothetical protein